MSADPTTEDVVRQMNAVLKAIYPGTRVIAVIAWAVENQCATPGQIGVSDLRVAGNANRLTAGILELALEKVRAPHDNEIDTTKGS